MYLDVARVISQRGTCKRLQVGCVIARDNRIIATGYNGPPSGEPHCSEETCDLSKSCMRAIHAEENAICFAAREGISLSDTTLYCMYSPCIRCARMIVQSGIETVVFTDFFDRDYPEVKELFDLNDITLYHYA
jgi:dCMP deaminase